MRGPPELGLRGMVNGVPECLKWSLMLSSAQQHCVQGYKQSYGSSNADGQQGGWTSEPIKAFETGHDHGADCNCVAEPVAGPAKGAEDRTAHLASKIAAHTGWQAPGGRRTEAKKELNPWA